MLVYPAIFTQDSDYIMVTFPDVPEAITQGEDFQEAYEMAVEVLGFALEDYT
ncbi:TPA: type II toxin-antitoxin system HicB family antitoxin, partial [Streptococcus agalactiae]